MMKNIFILSTFLLSPFLLHAQRMEKQNSGDTIQWKEFEINNNKWGTYKIKKGNYSQTIYKDQHSVGWSWNVPKKSYGVLGYPMIALGGNTWEPIASIKKDNYLKKIDQIKEFSVKYDTHLVTTDGKYNLAFDFWLHNQPKVGFETIGSEIMIWEDYQKFKPFGKKKGQLISSAGTYDVYVGKIYKKELNKGWDYIAFVRKEKRTKGELNINDFIRYMISNKQITHDIYLSSFEFGTEVLNASGNIKVLEYNVTLD